MPVGAALPERGLLPMLALAALAEVGQVLQADQAVRVGVHDLPADEAVALVLQPSLSPREHDQASRRRASAFALQAIPQPGVVMCNDARPCAGKEHNAVLRVRSDGHIALPHIDTNDAP